MDNDKKNVNNEFIDSINYEKSAKDDEECSICLQSAVLPIQLPCGHTFCFLCAKGVDMRGDGRCALCRREIPRDFLHKLTISNPNSDHHADHCVNDDQHDQPTCSSQMATSDDQYAWFYEGRGGWWRYDHRSESEIERKYVEDDQSQLEMLLAGFTYIINFKTMTQYRKREPNKRRNIKRALAQNMLNAVESDDPNRVKGIGGLKLSTKYSASASSPQKVSQICNDSKTSNSS